MVLKIGKSLHVIVDLHKVLHHRGIIIICDVFRIQYPVQLVLELIECCLNSQSSVELRVNLCCVVHCHAYEVLESFEFFLNQFNKVKLSYFVLISDGGLVDLVNEL